MLSVASGRSGARGARLQKIEEDHLAEEAASEKGEEGLPATGLEEAQRISEEIESGRAANPFLTQKGAAGSQEEPE